MITVNKRKKITKKEVNEYIKYDGEQPIDKTSEKYPVEY